MVLKVQDLKKNSGQLHMNHLSSRNNRLGFKTSGDLLIVSMDSIEYISSNEGNKTGRCQHVTGWM